jgi:hypothetical protein
MSRHRLGLDDAEMLERESDPRKIKQPSTSESSSNTGARMQDQVKRSGQQREVEKTSVQELKSAGREISALKTQIAVLAEAKERLEDTLAATEYELGKILDMHVLSCVLMQLDSLKLETFLSHLISPVSFQCLVESNIDNSGIER